MTDLISELERAEAGSRELDGAIECARHGWDFERWDGAGAVYREDGGGIRHIKTEAIAHYTTSLDAALALVPEGWRLADLSEEDESHGGPVRCGLMRGNCESEDYMIVTATGAKTLALALCIAALKARA